MSGHLKLFELHFKKIYDLGPCHVGFRKELQHIKIFKNTF